MSAFYNEIDRYPAAWLRNLQAAGHIAPGVVDERSIADLKPEDMDGFTQAHFFSGIGVWSHALRLAGWPDDAPVWTGSCPCQPFSAAGKRGGHRDERHLWPAWFRLIRERRPATIFGEQVAGKAGLAWLDAVRADLEGAGYAVGAANLCAAGAGAPHIRQRVFFVAVAGGTGRGPWRTGRSGASGAGAHGEPARSGGAGELAHSERGTAEGRGRDVGAAPRGVQEEAPERERVRDDARNGEHAGRLADPEGGDRRLPVRERRPRQAGPESGGRGEVGRVGDTGSEGLKGREQRGARHDERNGQDAHGSTAEPGATSGFWSDACWVWCRDGVWRPHGPESFPLTLAHGTPGRVGRLRAYGNAIVAPLAAEFIAAFMEAIT